MANENQSVDGGKPTGANSSDVMDRTPGDTIDLSGVRPSKGGRPKGSKDTKPRANSAQKIPTLERTERLPAGEVSPEDAEYLADTCVLLLESGDEIFARSLAQKLAKVAPERGEDFLRLHATVGLNEKDKRMLRHSIKAIVRKYALLGRFGPEILLVVFLGQYAYRQMKLYTFVQRTVEEKTKKGLPPANGSHHAPNPRRQPEEFPGPASVPIPPG